MTRISPSLYPDPKALPATTHTTPGSGNARPISIGSASYETSSASESAPDPKQGYSHQFQIFDPDPDDIDAWADYRDAAQAALTALHRVLFAFVAAGIGALLWVNLIN